MLPRNRVHEYPGEGESRVRGNVPARFGEGGTGDPARDDRPLLYHIWLKWLHRLTQCSRFFLARDQKYLCPLETGGSESMLSSQFTDELNLVAHPVGIANS